MNTQRERASLYFFLLSFCKSPFRQELHFLLDLISKDRIVVFSLVQLGLLPISHNFSYFRRVVSIPVKEGCYHKQLYSWEQNRSTLASLFCQLLADYGSKQRVSNFLCIYPAYVVNNSCVEWEKQHGNRMNALIEGSSLVRSQTTLITLIRYTYEKLFLFLFFTA